MFGMLLTGALAILTLVFVIIKDWKLVCELFSKKNIDTSIEDK